MLARRGKDSRPQGAAQVEKSAERELRFLLRRGECGVLRPQAAGQQEEIFRSGARAGILARFGSYVSFPEPCRVSSRIESRLQVGRQAGRGWRSLSRGRSGKG